MKRAISISFLLLANMVLLAHAVVPHHHHNGLVVSLFGAHCEIEAHLHDHHGNGHDNSHDHDRNHGEAPHQHNDSSSEACFLNSIYTRIDNNDQKKISCSRHAECDCHQDVELTAYLPTAQAFLSAQNTGLSFRQKPFTVTYQTCISFNCVGLRAPPFC